MQREIIRTSEVGYKNLTSEIVERLSPKEAEGVVLRLIAERARVKEGGKFLSFSEFNENPDPLVNRLLARMLVNRVHSLFPSGIASEEIGVLSIESSASYLSIAVSNELERALGLKRPPRIIRARKLPEGEEPSPAMADRKFFVRVNPITAGGGERILVASMPVDDELGEVEWAIPIDDFKATGSTLAGGVELVSQLLRPKCVIPMAAIGKPEQEEQQILGANVFPTATALDVRFWGDQISGNAYVQVNDREALIMEKANANDFYESL